MSNRYHSVLKTITLSVLTALLAGCNHPQTPEEIRAYYVKDVHNYRARLNSCKIACPAAPVTIVIDTPLPEEVTEIHSLRNQYMNEARRCRRQCRGPKSNDGVNPIAPLALGAAFIAADALMD